MEGSLGVVGNHRPAAILGGVERVVDGTGEKLQEEFLIFLEKYSESNFGGAYPSSSSYLNESESAPPQMTTEIPIYKQQIYDMRNEGTNTLYVDCNHLFRYNDVLANAILSNYYRFEPYLRAALQTFVATHLPNYSRMPNSNQSREFWISMYNIAASQRLRELTTQKVGHLISVNGTITRTTEVRPELFVGTFRCDDCNNVVRNVEQQFKYTEPTICPNSFCQNRRNWTLISEQSTFVNWQRIRVQENATEIPPGSMPRCLDVIVRNDMVERAKPGDKCTFHGTLIVVPDIAQLGLPGVKLQGSSEGRGRGPVSEGVTGLKGLGVRDLTYKLAFLANMVQPSHMQHGTVNIRPEDDMTELDDNEGHQLSMTKDELDHIEGMKTTPQLYSRLVNSIAPSIYGHSEIKTGILLMLFGGVHKVTNEGINLRGDINVCIVGDPGTAKSQFLRYVIGFLPRSVYTSGKASSAAGLTASVLKDDETGDFTIEAGALMLADNGVCAIDEFDKMDISDQVAIHEAMEQQTISIAKAGIQATLNARTSILAAANPIGGRYDRRRTLRQNIAMTAPIMSRFDLFFVILDECDEQTDYNIARHILNLHRHRDEAVTPEFSPEEIARYIRYARTIKPRVTAEAAQILVEKYRQLRQNDSSGAGSSYRMTVRQLESMIRLSEALARLHCDSEVKVVYVKEACRLLKSSIIRVETDNIDLEASEKDWQEAAKDLSAEADANLSSRATRPQKLTINYDDYIRISNMLVYQLRRVENLAELSSQASDLESHEPKLPGMKKNDLIEWYMEQLEGEMNTVDDYNKFRLEVSSIIERLIHKDGVIIEMSQSLGMNATSHEIDPILIVHPNYVPL